MSIVSAIDGFPCRAWGATAKERKGQTFACYYCDFKFDTPGHVIDHIIAQQHETARILALAEKLLPQLQASQQSRLLVEQACWLESVEGVLVWRGFPDIETMLSDIADGADAFFALRQAWEAPYSGDEEALENGFADFLEKDPIWGLVGGGTCWDTATALVVAHLLVLNKLDLTCFKTAAVFNMALIADAFVNTVKRSAAE